MAAARLRRRPKLAEGGTKALDLTSRFKVLSRKPFAVAEPGAAGLPVVF